MIILSVDQASKNAGVSLWQHFPGQQLIASDTLVVKPSLPFAVRLKHIVTELDLFLADKPKVDKILFEGVRSRLVLVTVGAFLTSQYLDVSLNDSTSFVSPSTWKNWAKKRGATQRFVDVKGIRALSETGFDCTNVSSDDAADSIMMYLAWADKQ